MRVYVFARSVPSDTIRTAAAIFLCTNIDIRIPPSKYRTRPPIHRKTMLATATPPHTTSVLNNDGYGGTNLSCEPSSHSDATLLFDIENIDPQTTTITSTTIPSSTQKKKKRKKKKKILTSTTTHTNEYNNDDNNNNNNSKGEGYETHVSNTDDESNENVYRTNDDMSTSTAVTVAVAAAEICNETVKAHSSKDNSDTLSAFKTQHGVASSNQLLHIAPITPLKRSPFADRTNALVIDNGIENSAEKDTNLSSISKSMLKEKNKSLVSLLEEKDGTLLITLLVLLLLLLLLLLSCVRTGLSISHCAIQIIILNDDDKS